MIYLVTRSQELFTNDAYKIIGVDESLSLLSKCSILQADSETTGKDPHICKLLCFQLGSIDKSWQIIIDCLTIDIKLYKIEMILCIFLLWHLVTILNPELLLTLIQKLGGY